MASAPISRDRLAARIAIVDRHIRLENEHDLEGVLATFGDHARYDDEPWGEHVTDDAILVEVLIRGTHLGAWRSLPPTGRRVEIPLCGVYTFDGDDRLAGEKIYYDRGTVLRQLGVFHEPQSLLGQISILVTHPVTIARALARKIVRR